VEQQHGREAEQDVVDPAAAARGVPERQRRRRREGEHRRVVARLLPEPDEPLREGGDRERGEPELRAEQRDAEAPDEDEEERREDDRRAARDHRAALDVGEAVALDRRIGAGRRA
jgi:hypothetical protein